MDFIELTDEQKYAIQKNKKLLNEGEFEQFLEKFPPGATRSLYGRWLAEKIGLYNMLQSMDNIPDSAFYGIKTDKIIIPGNIYTIGKEAFSTSTVKEVMIEDGVEKIGEECFSKCFSLNKVQLPNTIKEIPKQAFANCENLKALKIPESVTMLGEDAFLECDNIRFVTPKRDPQNKLKARNKDFYTNRVLFVKDKAQTESIVESLLKEAYENMPNWLRARLNLLRRRGSERHNYGQKYKPYQIASNHNADSKSIIKPGTNEYNTDNSTSGNVKRDRYGDLKGANLLVALQNKNIDLTKAKFIEGEPPKSTAELKTDPRCQEPNIPFFYIDSTATGETTVYAPGLNDYESILHNNYDIELLNYPKRDLINYCRGFCYLDMSDPDNYYTKAQRKDFEQRRATEQDRKNDPYNRYGFTRAEQGRHKTKHATDGGDTLDKSGYKIVPISQRLQDKIKELDRKDILRVLNRYYEKVKSLVEEAQGYANQFAFDKYNSQSQNAEASKNLYSYIYNLTSYYDNLTSRIYDIFSPETSKAEREAMIDRLLDKDSYYNALNNLDKSIERIEKYLDDNFRYNDLDDYNVSDNDDEIAAWMNNI